MVTSQAWLPYVFWGVGWFEKWEGEKQEKKAWEFIPAPSPRSMTSLQREFDASCFFFPTVRRRLKAHLILTLDPGSSKHHSSNRRTQAHLINTLRLVGDTSPSVTIITIATLTHRIERPRRRRHVGYLSRAHGERLLIPLGDGLPLRCGYGRCKLRVS